MSISDIQDMTPEEHLLLRPENYMGSGMVVEKEVWTLNRTIAGESTDRDEIAEKKKVRMCEQLALTVKEPFDNIQDNIQTSIEKGVEMKNVTICVDQSEGWISCRNDGSWIPIKKVKKRKGTNEKIYFAVKCFSVMMASTNYDDTKKRTTIGRNGIGVKATCHTAKRFEIEHSDPDKGQILTAVFENGVLIGEPQISKKKNVKPYTEIKWWPNMEFFNMTGDVSNNVGGGTPPVFSREFVDFLRLNACDIVLSFVARGVSGFKVRFSSRYEGEENPVVENLSKVAGSFVKFTKLFYPKASTHLLEAENGDMCMLVHTLGTQEKIDIVNRSGLSLLPSKGKTSASGGASESEAGGSEAGTSTSTAPARVINIDDESFDKTLDSPLSTSFVNGTRTLRGGIHLDAWVDGIVGSFVRTFNSRFNKGKTPLKISKKDVFPFIHFFVYAPSVNQPQFDSQTKEKLTLYNNPRSEKYKLSESTQGSNDLKAEIEKTVKKMLKWNMTKILKALKSPPPESTQKNKKAKSAPGGKINLGSKLTEANKAGSAKSSECILYVVEGDSAAETPTNGRLNPDFEGVMAMSGKLTTSSKSTQKQVQEKFSKFMEALNLEFGVNYSNNTNFKKLRYGEVCIMTDRDVDGIHIQGLLIDFFITFFPELIERGYLSSFSTGIVEIPAKKKTSPPKIFYDEQSYNEWMSKRTKEHNLYNLSKPRYLKGLGSIEKGSIKYYYQDPQILRFTLDPESKLMMKYAFVRGFEDERKNMFAHGLSLSRGKFVQRLQIESDEYIEGLESLDLKKGKTRIPQSVQDQNQMNKHPLGRVNWKSTFDTSLAYDSIDIRALQAQYNGEMSVANVVKGPLLSFFEKAVERGVAGWDGLKDGQRKLTCILVDTPHPKKISYFSGKTASEYHYKHGEASMEKTAMRMGQSFCTSSNNLPLGKDVGQFGSRKTGGTNYASPRYSETCRRSYIPYLLPKDDFSILPDRYEDGRPYEKEFLLPILPLLLANGTSGMGVGHSVSVPSHNPLDILAKIHEFLDWVDGDSLVGNDEESVLDIIQNDFVPASKMAEFNTSLEQLTPWYRGFEGTISLRKSSAKLDHFDGFSSTGVWVTTEGLLESLETRISKTSDTELRKTLKKKKKCFSKKQWEGWYHILALPLGFNQAPTMEKFLQQIKDMTKPSQRSKSKTKSKTTADKSKSSPFKFTVKDYSEYISANKLHLCIKLDSSTFGNSELSEEESRANFEEWLNKKMTVNSTPNITCLDQYGLPHRFYTADTYLRWWMFIRLRYYEIRRSWKMVELKKRMDISHAKSMFIEAVATKVVELYKEGETREEAQARISSVLADLEIPTYEEILETAVYEKGVHLIEGVTESILLEDSTEDSGGETAVADSPSTHQSTAANRGYNYLLSMSLSNLTQDKVCEKVKEFKEMMKEFTQISEKSPTDMWREDIEMFVQEYIPFHESCLEFYDFDIKMPQ